MNHPQTMTELLNRLNAEGASESRILWEVQLFLDMKAREQGIPLRGHFELTPLCNLDCRMCYIHLNGSQLEGRHLLTVEEWKHLMQQAVDAGMMEATLSGGECLTYPGFDELYLFLHSLGIEVTVLTNGVLLDAERIEFFRKHPPKSVQITLYGSSEDVYERVTGFRRFEQVLNHVKAADAAGLPVTVSVTPNPFSQGDEENILRLAHTLGVDFMLNEELDDPREDTGRKGCIPDLNLDEYIRLHRLFCELKGMEQRTVPPSEVPEAGRDEGVRAYGYPCGGGRSGFCMDWQGKIHPCPELYMVTADAKAEGFAAAWQKIHQIANGWLRPAECESCVYREGCRQCPAKHLNAPCGHADPANCRKTRRMVQAGIIDF